MSSGTVWGVDSEHVMRITKFRSKNEIKNAASKVSISKGLESYRKETQIEGKSCSYSLETMKFYYGDVYEDRMSLLETYGDGRSIYMLAPWTNNKSYLRDSVAHVICTNIISMGYIPFIGIWYFEGRMYEEPSFAVDHGISESTVKDLLKKFNQRAVYRVTPDNALSLDLNSVGQVT